MIPPKLRSLFILEIRRASKPMLRLLGVVAVVMAVMAAVGKFTPDAVGFVALTAALAIGMSVSGATITDKLDGMMEFVAFLPVAGTTVASAKFSANALLVLPLAITSSVLVGWVGATAPELGIPLPGVLATFFGVWLLGTAWTCFTVGVTARFGMQKFMTLCVLPAMAMFFVFDRFVGDLQDWIARAMAANPDLFKAIAVTVAVAMAFAALGTGFLMVRSAFDNFDPKSDAIER